MLLLAKSLTREYQTTTLMRPNDQARRAGAVVPSELDHQPDAVLALGRERDGARAVEGGAMRRVRVSARRGAGGRGRGGQETVLNPKRSCRD